MNITPNKIAAALFAAFATGLLLVAVGLGLNSKLAAFGVGACLVWASTTWLAGGVR